MQVNGTDGMTEESYLLQQLLENANELKAAHRANQELRKRERELTDRFAGGGGGADLVCRAATCRCTLACSELTELVRWWPTHTTGYEHTITQD